MCSSGSKNPRFFGRRSAAPTRGVVIRISLMRYTTAQKRPGNQAPQPSESLRSQLGRKESRPRTEPAAIREAGLLYHHRRKRGQKLSGRARTTFDTRERARAPNPARHLKDTYVPSVLGAWGDQFSCNHLLHFVSPSRRHFELVSADDGPFERRC